MKSATTIKTKVTIMTIMVIGLAELKTIIRIDSRCRWICSTTIIVPLERQTQCFVWTMSLQADLTISFFILQLCSLYWKYCI